MKAEHDGSDLQTIMNVHRHHGQDILPNMTRAPHVKYITYYEDAESLPGWRTAVWELDKGANLVFFSTILYSCSTFPHTRSFCITMLQGSPLGSFVLLHFSM